MFLRLNCRWLDLKIRRLTAFSFSLLGILSLISGAAFAMPVAPRDTALKQKDARAFHARPFGDEWVNGYETIDGYTVVTSPESGDWEYAEQAPDGTLRPSGLKPDRDNPSQLKKHLRDQNAVKRREARNAELLRAPDATASGETGATDPETLPGNVKISGNTGSHKVLVILAKFDNRGPIGTTAATWQNQFFGPSNSVRHYYKEVSYHQLTLNPAIESEGTANDGIVGWIRVGATHPNPGSSNFALSQQITRDAVLAANPYVNYASYDTNLDGKISPRELHIVVIVAGYEQSYGGTADSPTPNVWGHQYTCDTYAPTCDGKKICDSTVGSYTQFGEWMKSITEGTAGFTSTLGIMVHEMGHDLRWPDLYDIDSSSNGIGEWSVMASGGWLRTTGHLGTKPCHPDAFSKAYQGWITPQQISGTALGTEIPQVETSGKAFQLLNNPGGVNWVSNSSSGTGEYFLVENRQKVGYDEGLNGCGLLVWHIDETRTSSNSCNATDSRRLVDLEEADGAGNLDTKANRGDAGDPYPGTADKQNFSATSVPNSNLYSSASSGVIIRNISACAATMSADLVAVGPYFTGATATLVAESCAPANGTIDPGETVTVNIALQNTGSVTASSLVATLLPSGGVTVPSSAQVYGPMTVNGSSVSRSFTFTAAGNCGGPLTLSLKLQDGVSQLGILEIPLVMGAQEFQYAGLTTSIPDGTLVQVPFTVSGLSGQIADVDFKFGGSSCSTNPASTTVGVSHGYVGDLEAVLISPAGTRVVLMSTPGKISPVNAANLCNTIFDDEAVNSIQDVEAADAPFTGRFLPTDALAAFDGENPNGAWTLEFFDYYEDFTGTLRDFSVVISPTECCGSGNSFQSISDDSFAINETQVSPANSGWSVNGQNDPTIVSHTYNAAQGAYRVHVFSNASRFRQTGWVSNRDEWLPYSVIGTGNYVRGKFYVYAGGQANPSQLDTIPNFKLRLANRFAVTSDLHVMLHDASDPGNFAYTQELRPSSDPSKPSIYRIDFDPIDVPYLQTNTNANEGVLAGFEVFTLEPQDNGFIALTECELGVYPAALLSSANALQSKSYAPSGIDAGSLKMRDASELRAYNYVPMAGPQGTYAGVEATGNLPTHSEGPAGITLDTRAVPSNRIGFIARDFFAGNGDGSSGFAQRIRSAENGLFKVRWHVTSTQPTTNQASLWLQQRTIKYGWTQTLQLAGGRSSNSENSQALGRQTLPGIGSLNPDKLLPGENGGWYTALVHSPLQKDIRPEFAASAPLTHRMPNITMLPGPGIDASSNRDLKLAAQVYDSISIASGWELEGGLYTIDRIEVQAFDAIAD